MPREKIFRFKQFSVVNDKTAMKVGTDGVLLGAWCDVSSARRILDVGTGCGVIALMVAQRNSMAMIDAIDIDVDSIAEASHNFAVSPWGERLTAIQANFTTFTVDDPYDLIVSNPPFFTNGVLSPEQQRNQARHNTMLKFDELINHSCSLLTPTGVIAIITPADAQNDIRRSVIACGMNVRRITEVVPVAGLEPKRLLWELTRAEVVCHTSSLAIESAIGCYSPEYVSLTRDFYLKF